MKNITDNFGTMYTPVKALVVFQKNDPQGSTYIESYDMNANGYPVNAHPLSLTESAALANALDTSDELRRNFLKPLGLLPKNVLYINPDYDGYALWYTPAMEVALFFLDKLAIPNGKAAIPPLIWKASKKELYIFAMDGVEAIEEQTPLYRAPFFNIYDDGRVCMGTVSVDVRPDCLLQEFMQLWESYFFNSYFSHLLGGKSPVRGNIIQLWQSLIGSGKAFPIPELVKNGRTLKKLLS
ncbi:PRTRC system protein B [Flavobacterium subsaxonicum]|uniref:PRTRC system protein B n=1 Tax=Flavobacterium subsaxonicum WB 4.1-42 = DSM 21790 TaxID=1121898 RepID=A0A0A2MZI7_9FLAO|nr:PRTRC system protein B [Flavobacterium subsaxonicum]KGO93620.1 PRTRC system protein B [Flavobacterium subsaxonicum WB 4.1-42 = DSM 21790]